MGLLATLSAAVVLLVPLQATAWRAVRITGEDAEHAGDVPLHELEGSREEALRRIARLQLRPHDPREVEELRAQVRRLGERIEGARRPQARAPAPQDALRCLALPVPEELRAPILALSFDPRGERLAVLLERARFLVFERAPDGRWALTRSLAAPTGAFLMAARPSWEWITLVGIDSLVHILPAGWKTESTAIAPWVCAGSMNADGLFLRSGDNRIYLNEPRGSLREIHESRIDLRVIAAGQAERGIWLALATGELRRLSYLTGSTDLWIDPRCKSDPTILLEDPDSGWLLAGHAGGCVHAYDGRAELARRTVSSASIRSLTSVRPGSRRWIATCADGGLVVFTLRTGGEERALEVLDRVRPAVPATAVGASPKAIAIGTHDGQVLLAAVEDWPALTPGRE